MKESIIEKGRLVISKEIAVLQALEASLNDSFKEVIELLFQHKGRVVVSGIGKSAIIAQKLVATLNSTGYPALFLHTGDAIHGDIGMLQAEDILILLSKSGNSPELKSLLSLLATLPNKLIGIGSNSNSDLAKQANHFLFIPVDQEADPNNLAPTSSTTAQLALGDAIAICLLELKGFKEADFAKLHPGGSLGKKLLLKVEDILDDKHKPKVFEEDGIEKVIIVISENRLGATAVQDENENVTGIITDGDLRRMLQQNVDIKTLKAKDIMSSSPKKIDQDALANTALEFMRKHKISQLIVEKNEKYNGLIHLHDLIKEGLH